MRLSQEQIERFDRDGYLFFPSLFTPQEIKALNDEVPSLYAQRRPENVREKTGDVVRTNFAAHRHQDYGTWRADDQMPEARAMNIAIFLDEVNEFNGPLMFIPGSHKQGVLDASHDTSTTSYPLWVINHDSITQLVAKGGIVAPKGPAGSMILFHGCLVHASTSNLSPWNRVSVYLSLCAVSNHIRRFKRPGYIAHRDFSPIKCLPDDCLLKHYDVPLPWKNGTPNDELKAA
jgi:ectoine hydroxylase